MGIRLVHANVMIRRECSEPQNVCYRYMYWTDWGDEARIERAGMDGTNRSILHNTNLVWPNGLTLDIPGQKIYWIDASLDTIEFSFTDGSGRTLLDRQDDVIFHPFSLTFADDFLFWSDWVQLTIFTTHRDRPNDNIVQLDLFTPLIYPPHGIEAVTPDRQPQGSYYFLHGSRYYNVVAV